MSARIAAERKAAGLPPLERRSLAYSIQARAEAIVRAAKRLDAEHRWPALSTRDLETLDRIDMELERLKLQTQRVAD